MALSGPSPFAARNNVPRNPPLSSLGTSPFPSHIAGRGASQAQLNSPLSSAHPTHGLATPTFVAYITPNLPLACRHTPPTPLPRPPRVPPFSGPPSIPPTPTFAARPVSSPRLTIRSSRRPPPSRIRRAAPRPHVVSRRAALGRPSPVSSQVRRFAAALCSPDRTYAGVATRVARGGRCLAQSR